MIPTVYCFDNDVHWKDWVESECDIQLDQADKYVRVFNRFGNTIGSDSSQSILAIPKLWPIDWSFMTFPNLLYIFI